MHFTYVNDSLFKYFVQCVCVFSYFTEKQTDKKYKQKPLDKRSQKKTIHKLKALAKRKEQLREYTSEMSRVQ